MIDTIRFKIRGLSPNELEMVSSVLDSYIKVENVTGEQLRCVQRGHLEGSYDYRVMISVKDDEYVAKEVADTVLHGQLHALLNKKKAAPVQVTVEPYLDIEFSLAKWAYGANFFNVPLIDDIRNLMKFRSWLEGYLGVFLPDLNSWEIQRVDMAVNYDFQSQENIRNYIELWRNLEYPRRQKPTFWADSLYVAGFSTTLKLYNKLPEWQKHDKKRIKSFLTSKYQTFDETVPERVKAKIEKIEKMIEGTLRFEIEFHKRKLDYMHIKYLKDITTLQWENIMATELKKMIGQAPNGRINTISDVQYKLKMAFNNGYMDDKNIGIDACLAIWTSCVTVGRKNTLRHFGKNKFYRATKVFRGLSIGYLTNLREDQKAKQVKDCDICNFVYSRQNTGFHRIMKSRGYSYPWNRSAVNF